MRVMSDQDYDKNHIRFLEKLWGEGFLSPGGASEVDLILGDLDLSGKRLLDFGCGCGGALVHIATTHAIDTLVGIDIEAEVVDRAREIAAEKGIDDKVTFETVSPDNIPFPDNSFDAVFSKDSLIHVVDKKHILTEIFRVLKPGGWLVAGDWMTWDEGRMTASMRDYIKAEGLDFHMGSLGFYETTLAEIGFADISVTDRNAWYFSRATKELEIIRGDMFDEMAALVGEEEIKRQVGVWEKMLKVLESGEHRPGHFRALKR